MTASSKPKSQLTAVAPGAEITRTPSGARFDSTGDIWRYRDGVNNVSLDFSSLTSLSPELRSSAKAVLRWYAENRSSNHLTGIFDRLLHFSRTLDKPKAVLNAITSTELINYRAQLDAATAWYLGTLAGFFRKWSRLGYSGVTEDALRLLNQLRVPGNQKGVAVLTMDPVDGPLTHIEMEGLQAALNSAYAAGKVSQDDFVLAWLYMLLGQRNTQYAALKVCDVQVRHDSEGRPSYWVLMPSAKKGTATPRDRRVERPLVEQFGEVLAQHAAQTRRSFEGVLPDASLAPLFPARRGTGGAGVYALHMTAHDLGRRLTRVLENLCVTSERTGEPINVSAVRFRRTVATRAAEEGYGPLVIAGLLDHTDTQNVGVYTANSPAIIERIDRAIALEMAPLAQAFAGTLAPGSSPTSNPAQRIIDLRIDRSGQAMGECGKHGFCGFSAPIACYTCQSFEAWLDGPHEAVLNHLLERREQLLKTSDKRMASVNDRTILAVAAVVQRCSELQALSQERLDG